MRIVYRKIYFCFSGIQKNSGLLLITNQSAGKTLESKSLFEYGFGSKVE